MNITDIFIQYSDTLLSGLTETLKLAGIVWLTGISLGILLGILGSKYPRTFGIPISTTTFLLSGLPLIVILFWLHYPLQAMFNIVIDPFITSAFTLSIINIFSISEIIRRVLRDFPREYLTAAKVCGLKKSTIFTKIQVPLILRQIIPSILSAQVAMLQMTLFASLISVDEIFRTAQRINSEIYRPVEIYSALGLLFLIVCLPLNGIALCLRNKYTRDLSEV